jgi:hypothetical protein
MTFGGEVHYGARLMLSKQRTHEGAIADVAHNKIQAGIVGQSFKVRRIGCVGQRIKDNDRLPSRCNRIQDKIGTNKPGAASDKKHEET